MSWLRQLATVVIAGLVAAQAGGAAASTSGTTEFLGPDGAPLPFASRAEVLEFLRQAEVVSSKRAPGGITGARKLLLERDGIRAHAVFRNVRIEELVRKLPDGRIQTHFRDHCMNELAAQALARVLGLETVPPTVVREVDGKVGALQLWIERAQTEKSFRKRELLGVARVKHRLQIEQMHVFDNLINNTDRNLGNFLTDDAGRVWYIDHTRSFSRVPTLPTPSRVDRCSRAVWERLRHVTDEEIVEALAAHLDPPEIEGVLARRHLLVDLLESRIAETSPGRVLFGLDYVLPPTR
jgi:hypothetical protein